VSKGAIHKIWALTAAGAAVAVILAFTAVRGLPVPQHNVPFWVLIILFTLAEIVVVHIESRSQTHTYSLVEAPIVLGLLAAHPLTLLGCQAAGAFLALSLYRRQQPIKLAFNLCAFALETEAALFIFHGLATYTNMLAGWTIAAVFAATLTASLISLLSVFVAIAVADGTQTWAERAGSLSFGLIATGVTTSTVLVGVVLDQKDSPALWLLGLPIIGVYLAERAFATQIREHRKLRSLRRSAALAGSLGVAGATDAFLAQICQIFGASVAALAYFPAHDQESVALAVVGPGTAKGATGEVQVRRRDEVWRTWDWLAPERKGLIVSQERSRQRLGALLGGMKVSDAMIVPLFGDLGVTGYLVVANPVSEVSPFSSEDVTVLETLERIASIGLDNGELERSLEEARILEQQLLHRATHDHLTGLANRSLLADHLARGLDDPAAACALLLIDIDNFKEINDRFGHRGGDQVLVSAAQRVLSCLHDGDLAARLGGDELAIVARIEDERDGCAAELANRVVAILSQPVPVGVLDVEVSVSIGIAFGRAGGDADALLGAADVAMYRAKSAGKGCIRTADGLVVARKTAEF
jgi:diguanylate cyclase (GGDEF)-like protein